MIRKNAISFLLPLLLILPARGQNMAEKILRERGEVYIIFPAPSREKINRLTRMISIDAVRNDSVIACVNDKGYKDFLKENIPYRLYFYPRPQKAPGRKSRTGLQDWTSYPTYQQYDSIMRQFASAHPDICRLDTIGTSFGGRLLLAVKISDHVNTDEAEPEFFYTSTMHGDETGGYILMLRLIDYLLKNYSSDSSIRTLVDSLEIWINPLANPDGTYHDGDSTVTGATRFNAQGIDLNRNFPNPADGPHPDGHEYAPGTVAMMQFMQAHHFIMSANFHAGEEVVNYPWDTWTSSEKTHADDAWFRYISHEYADTAQAYSPAGYMTYGGTGVTNGGDWYVITGGRQDYVTWYLHGRETTIELDNTKITPEDKLESLWQYNYRSLLHYMEEALWGIAGTVTDSVTGAPVQARIVLPGHDTDSSWIGSDSLSGYYHRLLLAGTYDLEVSAPGYHTASIPGVTVTNHHLTRVDVSLSPITQYNPSLSRHDLYLYPNPVRSGSEVTLQWPRREKALITFAGSDGHKLKVTNILLRKGENRLNVPAGYSGICFITIRGDHSRAVTLKLVILP